MIDRYDRYKDMIHREILPTWYKYRSDRVNRSGWRVNNNNRTYISLISAILLFCILNDDDDNDDVDDDDDDLIDWDRTVVKSSR